MILFKMVMLRNKEPVLKGTNYPDEIPLVLDPSLKEGVCNLLIDAFINMGLAFYFKRYQARGCNGCFRAYRAMKHGVITKYINK